MKRRITCIAVLLLSTCILSCCASYHSKQIEYYSQKENYVNATGVLEFVQYNDDCSALYLAFSEITPFFDDNTFKIVGENVQTVKRNEIDSKLQPGDKITFISAPRYFGDGYVFPIVALSVHETSLLDFEEGLSNLIDWLSEQ